MKLHAEFHPTSILVNLLPDRLDVRPANPIAHDYNDVPSYDGPVTVTPGDEAQTLSTEGLWLHQNVVIEAIPQNYGKITWNGSFLTVS